MSGINPSLDCHARKRKTENTADFSFEVTQNEIPGEHYSFRDQIVC